MSKVIAKHRGNFLILAGCLFAAIGVALGAIGAHLLEKWLAETFEDAVRREELWETGVRYQMYCAFGLLAIGIGRQRLGKSSVFAASLLILGIFLFSGCLYAYVITSVKPLVHIVPLGGLSMIAGWVTFGFSALAGRRSSDELGSELEG